MFGRRNRKTADAPPDVGPGTKPPRMDGVAETPPKTSRTTSKGQQAYEARRAQKAGVGLEKWMADKERRVQADRDAEERARRNASPPKKPGLLRRLLDKAHKPL